MMIRFCPNCQTERPLSEIMCAGLIDGAECEWDLSNIQIQPAGSSPKTNEPDAPQTTLNRTPTCANGHAVTPGDMLCPTCGADIELDLPQSPPPSDSPTTVDGWEVISRLSQTREAIACFIVRRTSDDQDGVLTLYNQEATPDPEIYEALRSIPRDHIPEFHAAGVWDGHLYEVTERLGDERTLIDFGSDALNIDFIRSLVEQIGRALNALASAGIRHRNLSPEAIRTRSTEPLNFVITKFGLASQSEFDLDVGNVAQSSRYSAPEAIAGGVSTASDWWSLGITLLEHITQGTCFQGIDDRVFLIHALANGIDPPSDLDPSLALLLRGLLTRDHRERWQWAEVRAWLDGEPVNARVGGAGDSQRVAGPSPKLAGTAYTSPKSFALAAAQEANWAEAREHVVRGAVATWAAEAKFDSKIRAELSNIAHLEQLSGDLKLALALKVLHPEMPLVLNGEIITPGWLLTHFTEGYDLITGSVPDVLRRLETENWLSALKARVEAVRTRLAQLEIEFDEEQLRINLLSTSMPRLQALWTERRRLLPDSDHPGLASLMQRRQTSEEDLILLLSANIGQFRARDDLVREAAEEAREAGIRTFNSADAEEWLGRSPREIFAAVDERLQGFGRCGIQLIDEWGDRFRSERRMPLARALALLSIPKSAWNSPPGQAYVSAILDFFSKKISGGSLRGPLARMTIGKTTARVDLYELGTRRQPALDLLKELLQRGERPIDIDPSAFSANDTLERRLRSLHSHALLYRRDTGIDGLYMGFPFLLMRDARGVAKTRIAPVLLWPIKINPEIGGRGHITIGFGRDREGERDPDAIMLNPAFEGLLGFETTAKWQEAANDLLSRAAITPTSVLEALERLVSSSEINFSPLPNRDATVGLYEKKLVSSAVLFHLNYMGQAIVKDLQHLKQVPPENTGLAAALRLTPKEDARETSYAKVPEAQRFFTADSDPSQEQAVLQARRTRSLVVEGPPGTGKSQTIVNMVGDAIGNHRSLLIICQKQPALDVVHKRLVKEGLGDRIVMISDLARDRQPTIRAVREQVEQLSTRTTNYAPGWKRRRESLAGRIEAVEAELDEHHVALHQLDDQTGLTYRTLLGELIGLDAGLRPPLDVPALRPLLAKENPSTVSAIQETCGPLSKQWLYSKFEGSALSVLKRFTADRTSVSLFNDVFSDFKSAETERIAAQSRYPDAFKIDDPRAYSDWLEQHRRRFSSLDEDERAKLARWSHLFDQADVDQTPGSVALRDLVAMSIGLPKLDSHAHTTDTADVTTKLSIHQLKTFGALAGAIGPTSLFGRLHPARWLKRRRLRTFLVSNNLDPTSVGQGAFVKACALEIGYRPYRQRFDEILVALGISTAIPVTISPSKLRDVVERVIVALEPVRSHMTIALQYPKKTDIAEALRAGTAEQFGLFIARVESSLELFRLRASSAKWLDALSSWFESEWVEARQRALDSGTSNESAISSIERALPTLVDYQGYRLREARLGNSERAIFRTLRAKEGALLQIPADDLETEVRRMIEREARLAWKARLEEQRPILLNDRDELTSRVKALEECDKEIRTLNRSLLMEGIDRSRVAPISQWEAVTRLTGQRTLRLREFIDRASTLGLMELRPVWLMNPDVASRVLVPKPAMFDTVIYDEASQMPVEHALPTLFRAGRIVISGDDKQMPPTSFFSSRVESDESTLFEGEEPDDDASEEEKAAYSETWNRREIKDCPDLLELAKAGEATRTTLEIHYRSAYRELIAFSNASFYENRLSVPVRHPEDELRRVKPIEFIDIKGLYQNQTNRDEAQKVVELLGRIWSKPEPPTVGVVTFNRKQADLIDELIEDAAETNTAFQHAFSRERDRVIDGEDMSFFVKNVENVQGDERDIIIFSSTFGTNQNDRFLRFFGVLGQTGGERRLNVAVTRARQKVIMVCSMPIDRVANFLANREPPKRPADFLQGYLEYARLSSAGDYVGASALLSRLTTRRVTDRSQRRDSSDGFVDSVAAFLGELGWRPTPVQDDGAFGFDFAIEHPHTGLYGIGVECDAPRHPMLTHARAREIWRPHILRRAVPHVHRVSSRGWYHSGGEERARLKSAVERALR